VTISELGSIGELLGSILTLVTVAYLAVQIRQNTAQQKREELISIQHGQNSVVAQLQDPRIFGGFVRGAAGRDPSIEDRAIALTWVIQYLNHFEIVHDRYKTGALDEEQYQLWAGFAVAMVAPVHIRKWWDDEDGRLGFHSDVREMIDQRLNDRANPPRPITEMWTTFNPEAWESALHGSES
jgi:hypothetical protein